MAGFRADFDIVGLGFSLGSIAILFYFGLMFPAFFQTYWVAFGFWIVGFFGSYFLGIIQPSKLMTFNKILGIAVMTGLLILIDFGIQTVFAVAVQGTTMDMIATKALSFSVGVSEELFFGIFALGILINWMGLHPFLAILISAVGHTFYHVPNWGANPFLLCMWFLTFLVMRSLYVYVFPKAGMLLGWHGIFNFGVA